MDQFTYEKIQSIISTTRLTEFERLLVDYFFLADHSHPTMTGFRRTTNIRLTNDELQTEMSRVLKTLKGSLAEYRITRLSDVM